MPKYRVNGTCRMTYFTVSIDNIVEAGSEQEALEVILNPIVDVVGHPLVDGVHLERPFPDLSVNMVTEGK